MSINAMRTALALYDSGTLDRETAARQAGVSVARFERAAARYGARSADAPRRERPSVASD